MFRSILPFVSREALLRHDYVQRASVPWQEVSTVPRKLLIVRLSAVGDVVHVLPSLKTLRKSYPSAHIAWLVEDKAGGILRGHPDLDEILVLPKKRWLTGLTNPLTFLKTVMEISSFVAELRQRDFDVILDFQGNLKSGIMTFLSGTPLRVGFARGHCREGNFLFTNRRIAPPSDKLHKIEKNLSLLEGLGLKPVREGVTLSVSGEDEKYITSNLLTLGLPKSEADPKGSGQGPLVVIHSGTSDFGAYKRWPTANYAQLADRLVEELNARILFTWGPGELERVKEILDTMKHPGYTPGGASAHPAPRTEALGQLVSLIKRADLFISGDTGPMHIASILGVPQVAIFGPKDPVIYGPYQKKAIVVRKELDCSPCTKRTCDDPICITSIMPEEVFEAAKTLLSDKNFAKKS